MPTFHTGFSSLARDGIETDVEHAGECGMDFVELTMNDYSAAELSANADRIRTLAEEHDLDLLVHLPHGGSDAMVGSSDEEVRRESRRQFETAIEAAGEIGAEKAVLHVDAADELLLTEVGRSEDLRETVDELATTARRHDVEICVENMLARRRRRMSPADVYELVDRTGTSMTFDTGHARSLGYDDADMVRFLAAHGDVVSHFHLNDTRGTGDEHLPFGAGNVDFEALFSALPADWEGTLTLEISTPSYEYIAFSHRRLRETLERV